MKPENYSDDANDLLDLLALRIAERLKRRLGLGRPRSSDRCPCQEMTKARAQKRGHVCEAKETA